MLTLRSKVIWLQLSFELVAAKCHRHLAFRWVRILSLDNEKRAALATLFSLVGVSGFEPEASWTRTKRDTKLRHTPIAPVLYSIIAGMSSAVVIF